MLIFHQIPTLHAHLHALRLAQQSIGFVPTMGALHAGHLALVAQASAENDCVVVSIYVNPTQFNNAHDLAKYPRTLEADCQLLAQYSKVVVFAPTDEEMYPVPPTLRFDFGDLETVMEGAFRPGHFNGVGLVVSKLFHAVQPDKAYFGQKDLQQCAVIKRLVSNLNFGLSLVICPTTREEDGLAMSSRNTRLSAEQRQQAQLIPKTLWWAAQALQYNKNPVMLIQEVQAIFADSPLRLEYFEIAHPDSLQSIAHIAQGDTVALCIAAYAGEVRLIDNILLTV